MNANFGIITLARNRAAKKIAVGPLPNTLYVSAAAGRHWHRLFLRRGSISFGVGRTLLSLVKHKGLDAIA
jgi:hypothetical protein